MNKSSDALLRAKRTRLFKPVLIAMGLQLFPLLGQEYTLARDYFPSAGELKKLPLEELMTIEVTTVSRRPEKLSTAASAIQVVTGEEIRRSGATSLPEALRLARNLQVAQIDSANWAITSRGFSANSGLGNKLLVMMDGRSIYTPLFAGVFWDAQDTLLEDIDRIEVVSGPGGTMWGANAVNGVINIITKHSRDTQGLLLSGAGGTELAGLGSLRYGGTFSSNVQYRVYTRHFKRDATALLNGADGGDEWRHGQAGFRLDYDPNELNQVTFQGDAYDGEFDRLAGADTRLRGGNAIATWRHVVTADSDFTVQTYYDRTYRKIPGSFREDLDTYDVELQHRFPIGEIQNVIWGLDYRLTEDAIGNSDLLAFLPPNLTRRLFSGFLQDEIQIVPERLTLTLGTKLDHNDYTGFEYQPSGRIAFTPVENQTLWAAVSRAVRTPSRIDRHFYVPASPPRAIQGGDFGSEELIAYELGYRIRARENLLLSSALFFHQYDKIRSIEPVSGSPGVFVSNGLEGESYGVELAADYDVLDWWRVRAGYTHLQVSLRARPGSADMSGNRNESHDPKHQVFLRSSWNLPHEIEFDADLRYISRIANFDVPNYTALTLRLAWLPRPNLELSLAGQNLLDEQHPEFGAATAARHEIERSIYGKVTWRY